MSPFSPAQLAADENNNATVFNFPLFSLYLSFERAKKNSWDGGWGGDAQHDTQQGHQGLNSLEHNNAL